MKLWQDFCILTAGYTKSCHFKKSLKAVKNTCQNCQMICKPYCWDKQHTNMSSHDRLVNGYALLPENDVWFFWVFLTLTHQFYQHETIFVWYFWIVTNTFKIYFWDISETSENKHLFEISLRRLKDVTWKNIFFEMYLRRLKDVSKKISLLRCFWEVFERFLEMEICLRHLKDISCRLGKYFESNLT